MPVKEETQKMSFKDIEPMSEDKASKSTILVSQKMDVLPQEPLANKEVKLEFRIE